MIKPMNFMRYDLGKDPYPFASFNNSYDNAIQAISSGMGDASDWNNLLYPKEFVNHFYEDNDPSQSIFGLESNNMSPYIKKMYGFSEDYEKQFINRDKYAHLYENEPSPVKNLVNNFQNELNARKQDSLNNYNTYTVKAGDSLSRIAARHGMSPMLWKRLAEINGLSDPNKINIGQQLYIPSDWKIQRSNSSVRSVFKKPVIKNKSKQDSVQKQATDDKTYYVGQGNFHNFTVTAPRLKNKRYSQDDNVDKTMYKGFGRIQWI